MIGFRKYFVQEASKQIQNQMWETRQSEYNLSAIFWGLAYHPVYTQIYTKIYSPKQTQLLVDVDFFIVISENIKWDPFHKSHRFLKNLSGSLICS
jgi:hypothetical protein